MMINEKGEGGEEKKQTGSERKVRRLKNQAGNGTTVIVSRLQG